MPRKTLKKQETGDEARTRREQEQFLPLAEKAHSIKNILQAIKGGLDVVDRSLTDEDVKRARRAWEILKENILRINDLVLDMLKYSRAGTLVLARCDFNEMIDTIVHSLHVKAHEKDAQLNLSLDDRIKISRMDIDRINDTAMNIIMNAIEAVDFGGGVIDVRTYLDEDRNEIVLEVEDNGPGIDPADIEAIFLPFHSSKKSEGTGLGLSIAQKTVQQHGGRIDVESEPGRGARFLLRLPIQ